MTVSSVEDGPTALRPFRAVELQACHLAQALELSRALQWPYRLEDWAFALGLGRGFAVEIEGRLAGTALWWPYGECYGSVGMIIVGAQDQRKGIGGVLMEALLADAAGRTLILNSTVEGKALYTRLGFVPYGRVHQHQAVLDRAPVGEAVEGLRSFVPEDRVAIHALDEAAAGMDRRALIDALLEISDVSIIEREGIISGYGCVREWGRGVVIGPIIAADAADARALIASLAAPHVGRFVRIDVPEAVGLSPWLETIGLPQVDHVVSMVLGNPPSNDPGHRFFALSNQSLG